jgi:hypothetical protein
MMAPAAGIPPSGASGHQRAGRFFQVFAFPVGPASDLVAEIVTELVRL